MVPDLIQVREPTHCKLVKIPKNSPRVTVTVADFGNKLGSEIFGVEELITDTHAQYPYFLCKGYLSSAFALGSKGCD